MKAGICVAVASAICALWLAPAMAYSDGVQYQGRLLDAAGRSVNSTVSVSVAVYTNETAGAFVYTESIGNVTVSDGLYAFTFGAAAGFDAALAQPQCWLQLTVNGAALTPRQRLLNVPYARRAALAEGVTDGAIRNSQVASDAAIAGTKLAAATTEARGTVQLASDGEIAASKAVQGNDSRIQGWTDDGTTVRLTTSADNVGIGTTGLLIGKLHVERTDSFAVYGYSIQNYGVYGNAGNFGVVGEAWQYGVYGLASQNGGVHGDAIGNYGVYGWAFHNYGVYGYASQNYGVYGNAAQRYGGYFTAANIGLYAEARSPGGAAIQTSGLIQQNGVNVAIEGHSHAVGSAEITDGAIIDADINASANITGSKVAAASTSTRGTVELATSAETTAGLAVQASDTRLSNARTPTGVAGGDLSGTYPNPQIAADSVGSSELVDNLDLGSSVARGYLDLFYCDDAPGVPAIRLDGAANEIVVRNDSGRDAVRLDESSAAGRVIVYDTNAQARVQLYGLDETSGGGLIYLDDANGNATLHLRGAETPTEGAVILLRNASNSTRVVIDGQDAAGGGEITLRDATGTSTLVLDGAEHADGGAAVTLRNASGTDKVLLSTPEGGQIQVLDSTGTASVFIKGNKSQIDLWNNNVLCASLSGDHESRGAGGLRLLHASGVETARLEASETGSDGAQLLLRNASGAERVILDTNSGANDCGFIELRNAAGNATIYLNANYGGTGDGRIVTDELQITGGSDLSEQFNISGAVEPGALVCIDPTKPGELCASTEPYAVTVAGIVSGANGIKPGMLMGQQGTVADGFHPVALTGRVYAKATAANGAIRPGDLLTSSGLPGHAMKATDPTRSFGAVVGKAMSSLDEGEGLVLVLVQPR